MQAKWVENTYGNYWISLNFNVIILIASFEHNLNFKIQETRNKLKMWVGFKISTTLVVTKNEISIFKGHLPIQIRLDPTVLW